jgi:CDP-paratose 2-epimerase
MNPLYTKTAISLLESIYLIEEINGIKPKVKFAPDRYADLRYFICDISKAQKELGWSSKILPKEGLSMLINWIKENRNVLAAKER